MRGTSRVSLAAAEDRLEPLLAGEGTPGVALGLELFSVADLLDSSGSLRRALTDPSREGQAKADLVARLLEGKVSPTAVDIVSGLVRDRWSEARDLADAVDRLGTNAVLSAADREGSLDTVEDELFRFARIVDGDRALGAALSDRGLPTERKTALVDRLLDGKVTQASLVLAKRSATSPRGRTLEAALTDVVQVAARRKQRLVAVVVAATPLTEQQRGRLARLLQRVYGRPVRLNVDVDPEVLGGLRVQVGDEVIDASVLSRLEEARRRLAR
jgi:F-type H+-transporting ATPase subunit delta